MNAPVAPPTARQRLRQTWQGMAARERRLVAVATALVAAAVAWWILFAPALRTLRQAPAEKAIVAEQLAHMRSLQSQAEVLQKQPALSTADSQSQLTALAAQLLGEHSLTVQGNKANVTLRNVPPQRLGEWLAQARSQARAVPQQAQLEYSNAGWNGSMVMRLP